MTRRHDSLCPDPQAACECVLIGKVRADERERIAQALATQEEIASWRWRDESSVYWEGARDAYDRAERIASAGGR